MLAHYPEIACLTLQPANRLKQNKHKTASFIQIVFCKQIKHIKTEQTQNISIIQIVFLWTIKQKVQHVQNNSKQQIFAG